MHNSVIGNDLNSVNTSAFTKSEYNANNLAPNTIGKGRRFNNVQGSVTENNLNTDNTSAFTKAEHNSNNSIENAFSADGRHFNVKK